MILIDLQKAFDTIDHKILLHKMQFFGFSEKVIKWYKCYLSERTFQVKVNERFSSSGNVTCGVPQGDRKSTRLNSSHRCISYAVFCLKKKKI